MVRPGSVNKQATAGLRAAGVEIRLGELSDGFEQLKKTVEGASVVISAVSPFALDAQREIIRAAKAVGVQRVIPCDFTIPGERGICTLVETVRSASTSLFEN